MTKKEREEIMQGVCINLAFALGKIMPVLLNAQRPLGKPEFDELEKDLLQIEAGLRGDARKGEFVLPAGLVQAIRDGMAATIDGLPGFYFPKR